jgi:glycosyltransferase involved in cell wall biosynthesis
VYNKEKVLDKCINSVLMQSFKDFELILVNDGSSDLSGGICEKFAKLDSRIKVIHKQNGGVSSARNIGIKNSNGEFIQFVDSDDYIDENMCKELIDTINRDDSDLVICGYKIVSEQNVTSVSYSNKSVRGLWDLTEDFSSLYKDGFLNSPWNKLYKRKYIKSLFNEDLSLGEDLLFNLEYFKNIDKISIIKDCSYNYVVGSIDSLTGQYRNNLFEIALLLNKSIYDFIDDCLLKSKIDNKIINSVLISNIQGAIQRLVYFSTSSTENIISQISIWINNSDVIYASKNVKLENSEQKIINFFSIINLPKGIYYFYKFKNILKNITK